MARKRKKTIPIDRRLVISDTHGELVDRPAFECVLQAIEILKPDGIIHIGDLGEWSSVNRHRFKNARTPEPSEMAVMIRKDARRTAKYVLNPLDEVCKQAGVKDKDITTGNHDQWLNQFVEINPDYADTVFDEASGYRFDQIYDWEKRGWNVHPCGQILKVGKLSFYHGHLYGGIHHAHNHLMKMGVNIMYGHWHDLQVKHVTHADGPKGAYSIGCLKSDTPDANAWLRRRPVNWSHVFAIVDFFDNGFYCVHTVTIIKGRCTLSSGEVIDGRKPRPLIAVKSGPTNRQVVKG